MKMPEVYINDISVFLPGSPVSNSEMEDYLGFVDGNISSKSKPVILRNNKITNRYYALDKNGNSTYSNAELTCEAIKGLVHDGFKLSDIELLTCGTTTPDQFLPSHASMVHGKLKQQAIEAISFSGSCCSGMNALKYAQMSILTGNTTNAVTTGSERFSQWMLANNFKEEITKIKEIEEKPILAFEKDFLRWMLSDGAAALLLQDKPRTHSINLKIEWLDIRSYANQLETCMYVGADKNEDGTTKGWKEFTPEEWLQKSIFSFKQDTKLLGREIVPVGTKHLKEILDKRGFDVTTVDYFLPHLSSEFFRAKIAEEILKYDIQIPQEKWFTNLTTTGNIGSASIFMMIEELMNSGKLKVGQKILLMVPESARFTYAYCLLTVC